MKSIVSLCCIVILLLTASCHKEKKALVYDNGPTDSLKINEVQFIASHNSYHLKNRLRYFFLDGYGCSVGHTSCCL
jgi:hypothetical protein